MKTFNIALYPGDGIGPEVMDQAVHVLNRVQEIDGTFELMMTSFPWGVDYWEKTGSLTSPDFLDVLRPFDAVLLGAVGDPRRLPDHITLKPLIEIRQKFDQYACVRPAKLFSGVPTPLAGKKPGEIDMVVIRENSEGEYVDCGGRFKIGQPDELAIHTAIHTRRGIERILRFGFELALTRRKRLTMVTKSNAMKYSYVLWDEILEEMRGDYPDIVSDRLHADAAAMNFVRCPESFDVVVASNLFGDILTDLGGLICGGIGLAPSANINPEREYPSMFEPVHGSAPDIVGKGIANPVGAILSAAMMLEWLGLEPAAVRVRVAVETTLSQGIGTPDLGGSLNTDEFTDQIVENLVV